MHLVISNNSRPKRRSPETGKGVDGRAWEGIEAGRKLINGVSDENMALIKCVKCGKDVSDKAESCPNCGNPNVL